jgi:uncharacterized delta-60 repeat protein
VIKIFRFQLLVAVAFAAGVCALPTGAGAVPIVDDAFAGGAITPNLASVRSGSQLAGQVAIQSDGKIVVPVFAGFASERQVSIARYGLDGKLDPTYGTGGVVLIRVPGSLAIDGPFVDAQPDDKLLVAGTVRFRSHKRKMFVARITAAGGRDSTFGQHGIAFISLGTHPSSLAGPASVTTLGDGRVLVSMIDDLKHTSRLTIVELGPAGRLDRDFGKSGIERFSFRDAGDESVLLNVAIDGPRAYALFTYYDDDDDGVGYGSCLIAAMNLTTGKLDSAFDHDGKKPIDTVGGYDEINCEGMALDGHGGIAIVGPVYGEDNEFDPMGDYVMRLSADGALNAAAPGGGVFYTKTANLFSQIAFTADGTAVVAGSRFVSINDPGPRSGLIALISPIGALSYPIPAGAVSQSGKSFANQVVIKGDRIVAAYTQSVYARAPHSRILVMRDAH